MTDAAIIIAFRDRGVDPLRQWNLDYVAAYWGKSNWPVYIVDDGGSGNDHFNRSRAYNRGTALTDANVLCYIESDTVLPYAQLQSAIEWAVTPGLIVPFSFQHKLGNMDSHLVRGGADYRMFEGEAIHDTWASTINHGSACVISRQTLRSAGQWDEAFEGHGHDDTAMKIAFEMTGSSTRFVGGQAHHLYHLEFDPGLTSGAHIRPEDARAQERNGKRLAMYQRARNPEEIRWLTGGGALQDDWRKRMVR